ncbi:hypothetical protein DFH07DRAFT_970443 [Mycena maculata]|uniref:Uncharacterized protein n=1 Tax=Mycena maculata TaxID=230809 RepID=A0AAD7HST3_9AGAR|nr:hypothetical protein DFH07DRAFT_970443 [Mycena maculata]
MAQTGVSRRAFLFFSLIMLFFFSPLILSACPQTAPLAPAFRWATDKAQEGLIVACLIFTLYFIHSLFVNLRTWLARAPPAAPATPTDLESGTAAATLIDVVPAAPAVPEADVPAKSPVAGKIAVLLLNAYAVAQYFYLNSIVSPSAPLLQNIGAALAFVLRGLEVLFVAVLLLAFVAWLKRPTPAALPTGPIEVSVVVEETVVSDADVPVSKEERVGQEKA